MPTYDYGCKACGHEFEREQRISEKPVKKCPSCGKLQAKRLISRTSFVLKGGGWYNDLYSSGKPADSKDSSKSDDGASSGSADSGSDSAKSGEASGKKASKGDAKGTAKSGGKNAKGGGKEAA